MQWHLKGLLSVVLIALYNILHPMVTAGIHLPLTSGKKAFISSLYKFPSQMEQNMGVCPLLCNLLYSILFSIHLFLVINHV